MKRIFGFLLLPLLLLPSCSQGKQDIAFISNGNGFETLYDDSYFLEDNGKYNQGIALASFASTMTTCGDEAEFAKRGQHLTSLWKKEGFSDILLSQTMTVKPTLDSIGYGIAKKKIEDFTLVAITIRSGSYGAEWASNLTIGEEGDSKGFKDASDTVLAGLGGYLSGRAVQGRVKFWLSGYSRGGAVANLLGADILQRIQEGTFYSEVSVTPNDVYAYCFEPPLCAKTTIEEASGDLYKGIHNLMNFNDMIARLLPHAWGFVRYGNNYFYPDRLTDIRFDETERKKLVSNYHFAPGGHNFSAYTIDDWRFFDAGEKDTQEGNLPRKSLHPSLGRFGVELIPNLLAHQLLTREIYAKGFEESIRNLIAAIAGFNPKIPEIKLTGALFVDILFSYSFAQSIFVELLADDPGGAVSDFEFFFYMLFNANEENIKDIKDIYNDLFYFLLFVTASLTQRKDLMLQLFCRDNLLQIALPHYTELDYYLLRSCDPRLYGEQACHLNDGTYQILTAHAPSSISIYENSLKKNIFSYADGKMESDRLSAQQRYDGSIDIFLPKNGDYSYEIESDSIRLSNVDSYGNETLLQEGLAKTGRI